MTQSGNGTIVGSNTAWGTGRNVSPSGLTYEWLQISSISSSYHLPEMNMTVYWLSNFEYGIVYQKIRVFEACGSVTKYIGSYSQSTMKILNGNNDNFQAGLGYVGNLPSYLNPRSNILNNSSLNKLTNDTGSILNRLFSHKVIDKVNVSGSGKVELTMLSHQANSKMHHQST